MACDCASMHIVHAKKLPEGIEGIRHLFLATHCVNCGKYIRSWSKSTDNEAQIAAAMMYSDVRVAEFPWTQAISTLLEDSLLRRNIEARIRADMGVSEDYYVMPDELNSVAICLRNYPNDSGRVRTAVDVLLRLGNAYAISEAFFPRPPEPEPEKKAWWKFW